MLLILAFFATFGLVISLGLLLFYRDAALQRLSSLVEPRGATSRVWLERVLRPDREAVEQMTKPFQKVLPRSDRERSVVQLRLVRAGYRKPSAVNVFYAAKVLVPLSLAALVTVTGIYAVGPFFIYAMAVGLGFLMPDFWLGNRIKARQEKMRLGLPEALDLMVICSEAGLSLDQSLLRASQELQISQPEISDEVGFTLLEQRAGRARDEALKGLSERTDVDSIRSLVTTLLQADSFGTSIAKTLRVYSDTMRVQRKQKAEEDAAKTTIKLVFPLVFFIFPSLFIVALGPSMIILLDGFEQFFQ